MTTAYLRVILSMEILISYAPYRHQRYSSTNSLKRTAVCMVKERVCFPYEFTLLSNVAATCTTDGKFVSPTNLHCSQTFLLEFTRLIMFVSPTNLHCSQTLGAVIALIGVFVSPTNLHCSQTPERAKRHKRKFVSPTNLHCSQTPSDEFLHVLEFVSPTNLHCSQTIVLVLSLFIGLFPLRIYTALKHPAACPVYRRCLFPLRIYTALKLRSLDFQPYISLFPLRIYTALKQ